jgi:hypothetical protein
MSRKKCHGTNIFFEMHVCFRICLDLGVSELWIHICVVGPSEQIL